MAKKKAAVVWRGGLQDGEGTIASSESGALTGLLVNWSARTGASDERVSPEELIAAAHASCFAMALALLLAERSRPPERLNVVATVTFVPDTGITRSELEVQGRVPGLSEESFLAKAEQAKTNCPVSQALSGLETTLSARLES